MFEPAAATACYVARCSSTAGKTRYDLEQMVQGNSSVRRFAAFLGALFLSGTAGLINQVVWQRALKVFLGGSETLSSMTVVIVFMAGLGAGSMLMGRRAARYRDPLVTFAVIEIALGVVNLLVCGILGLDLSDSVYAAERLAVGVGVPLRVVYVIAAMLL